MVVQFPAGSKNTWSSWSDAHTSTIVDATSGPLVSFTVGFLKQSVFLAATYNKVVFLFWPLYLCYRWRRWLWKNYSAKYMQVIKLLECIALDSTISAWMVVRYSENVRARYDVWLACSGRRWNDLAISTLRRKFLTAEVWLIETEIG